MQKLSRSLLALAVAALFLGEFSYGESTDADLADVSESTKDAKAKTRAESDAAGQPSDRACRDSTFENDDYLVAKGVETFKYHKLPMRGCEAQKSGTIEEGQMAVLNSTDTEALFKSWLIERTCVNVITICW